MNGAKRPQMLLTPKEEMAGDRDHQMKPGNDHIQKHMSGKPSLKRFRNNLFESAEAPRGGRSVTAEIRAAAH